MPAAVLIAALVVGLGVSVALIYNHLVRLQNRMKASWAQVDVQLERRHDLVPNLVSTVKGYAAHERAAFEGVATARSSAQHAGGVAPQARAESDLTGALSHLLALSEQYPELKANDNFLELQKELARTENRIAIARQVYNATV